MGEIIMPRLSDTMSEGTVGRWLKKVGDAIKAGDLIAEIETDKATMELPADESGTLMEIVVTEGKTVAVGTTIARLGDGKVATPPPAAPKAEAVKPVEKSAEPTPRLAAETTAPPPFTSDATSQEAEDRLKASPIARRIAEEKGVDLSQVQGTGPGGRIIKENVEDFIEHQAQAPAMPAPVSTAPTPTLAAPAPSPAAPVAPLTGDESHPLSRMRKAIARAMTEAKPGTPHIYVTIEVDMGEAMKLRKQINEAGIANVKISVNDLVVKAAAKALVAVPALNSSYSVGSDGQPAVIRRGQVNVSVAVSLEDGLVAPVVRDADKKSISAISAEVKELATRARDGKIKPNELDGATFQVSNLGMFDVVEFVSIITSPQAASLAVGAVRKVPVVRNDQIVIGEIMHVTLSADHRVVDGAIAAQYLQELRKLLESPMGLLV